MWIRNLQALIAIKIALFSFLSLAEETSKSPSGFEQFVPFLIIGLVFYFLLIRPQQKKYKRHNEFLSQIKRGDEVLTAGGIFGTIEGLTDDFIVLEVAENTKIRILKSQISSFINKTPEKK